MTYMPAMVRASAVLAELDRQEAAAEPASASASYEHVKRVLDVVMASLLLVACAPLLLVVAALIKLTSRGSIVFRQRRAGKDGRPFTMYKLRTMHVGAEDDREFLSHLNEQNGPVFKMKNDPRLTRFGRFLRRSSIDELPQLVNVLLGQMSIVGPRPLWLPEYEQARGAARRRAAVKPGLTCLWQICGRSRLSYEEWVLLDLYYVRHRSLLLDLMIMIQTIPAVLSAQGAY